MVVKDVRADLLGSEAHDGQGAVSIAGYLAQSRHMKLLAKSKEYLPSRILQPSDLLEEFEPSLSLSRAFARKTVSV